MLNMPTDPTLSGSSNNHQTLLSQASTKGPSLSITSAASFDAAPSSFGCDTSPESAKKVSATDEEEEDDDEDSDSDDSIPAQKRSPPPERPIVLFDPRRASKASAVNRGPVKNQSQRTGTATLQLNLNGKRERLSQIIREHKKLKESDDDDNMSPGLLRPPGPEPEPTVRSEESDTPVPRKSLIAQSDGTNSDDQSLSPSSSPDRPAASSSPDAER